jgi:hypothetical protein
MRNAITSWLACCLAVGAIGCTDYSPSVFIRQVQLRQPDDECIVDDDPDSIVLPSGLLDVSLNVTGYQAAILVGNQLVRLGDADQLKPEANRVQFFEAEIELLDQAGSGLGGGFFQTVSGFADPADGTEPGYGVVAATLIPPGGAGTTGTVVARVILRGVTLGGEEVETAFWDFPILVCDGCMASFCQAFEGCDDEPAPECFRGQDIAPDCRLFNPMLCP